jgi:putative membrane protein
MWLYWLLLIAIVVVVVVLIGRAVGSRTAPPPAPRESALDILKSRYARGEIGEEEFERRRHELEK